MDIDLVRPESRHLPAIAEALERGWTPDNVRGETARLEALARIANEPERFLAAAEDPEARAGDITLPDGSIAKRLPGVQRMIWDGEFCGSIGFRWQEGTAELPAHVLGHIGYSVVEWKRRRGYATKALALLLPFAAAKGLAYVELTTDPDNLPSQKVILANGGRLVGAFAKAAAYGGAHALKYRIDLDSRGA